MNREIDLSVSTYGVARQFKYDVAILPWGATEPHNLHLPYMTDCILSQAVALDAAERALHQYGVRCMVLPPVAMGSQNPGQRDLPFCIHYRYETQFSILKDIVASLQHQGIRRLLIVNGHGGNSFKQMIRDLSLVTHPSSIMIASAEWFKMASAKDFFEQPGDHADEIETSVMMHYHPELVRLEEAGEGKARSFAIEALRKGKVWMPRHWTLVTDDTGIGNPALSTAEKGRRFADACADGFARFLRDFSKITKESELYSEKSSY
ncbi:MAG: creatininase family protein [Prevotella sp.]|nr:creatininase family protein [Prevotella sp.]